MKRLCLLLLVLTLFVRLQAAPTKESFEQLLKLVDAQSVIDGMAQKLDAILEDQFDRALTNRETPEGLAYAESFRQKVQARFHEKITLPQVAAECYAEAGAELTQEEVDALITLCAKPAGRSALTKLSPVMRDFELLAQKHVAMFRMDPAQSMRTAMQELKEINTKALAARSPAPVAAETKTEPAKP
jgi:hypothetical protein